MRELRSINDISAHLDYEMKGVPVLLFQHGSTAMTRVASVQIHRDQFGRKIVCLSDTVLPGFENAFPPDKTDTAKPPIAPPPEEGGEAFA